MLTTLAQSNAPMPPPRLAPSARYALNAATTELHRMAWEIAQVAIDLNDSETIAAMVVVAYLSALERAEARG